MPDAADWPDAAPNLGLPFLAPSQAQKHVTVNEALRLLDALVQMAVLDRDRGLPPDDPVPGQRHIVGPGAAGLWAGQGGRIALWDGPGGWLFLEPRPGWRAWVLAEAAPAVWDGSAWTGPEAQALRADRLGVNTPADATNRLAVAGAATLLTHTGAGHQLKVNKAAAGDTASLLFQTGFSGRAEMGTAGSDAFAVKVSADGASWATALSADPGTGRVFLPAGLRAGFGSAGTPALAFDGDADTGLWRAGADALGIAAGGTERMRVTTGGVQVTGAITGTAVTQTARDTTAGRLLKVGDFGLGSTNLRTNHTLPDWLDQTFPTGFQHLGNDDDTPNKPAGLAGSGWGGAITVRIASDQGARFGWRSARNATELFMQKWDAAGWGNVLKFYNNRNLVGTVAQASGVPDGAAIETGGNANGRYVRLADGTQVCWRTVSVSLAIDTAYLGGFRSAAQTWTFPAAFAAAAHVFVSPLNLTAFGGVAAGTPGTTTVEWAATAVAAQTAALREMALLAVGRWV